MLLHIRAQGGSAVAGSTRQLSTACHNCDLYDGCSASVLLLLAGVEEAGMPAVVADIAVTMTKFTQDCIADGRLPGCGSHCYAAWWLHNLPDHLPMFGTRPWSTVQAPCLHEDEHMRGPMPPPRGSVSTTAAHERDSYADRCNLVVVAFKLFQSLTLRARQAQGSTQGGFPCSTACWTLHYVQQNFDQPAATTSKQMASLDMCGMVLTPKQPQQATPPCRGYLFTIQECHYHCHRHH